MLFLTVLVNKFTPFFLGKGEKHSDKRRPSAAPNMRDEAFRPKSKSPSKVSNNLNPPQAPGVDPKRVPSGYVFLVSCINLLKIVKAQN